MSGLADDLRAHQIDVSLDEERLKAGHRFRLTQLAYTNAGIVTPGVALTYTYDELAASREPRAGKHDVKRSLCVPRALGRELRNS